MATATKSSKKNAAKDTNGSRKRGDLSPNQFKVLDVLSKNKKPLTRAELAEKTGISKGWSRLLGASTREDTENAGLEGAGLVACEKPEDSRGLVYAITAKGRQALEKAKKESK